MAKILLIEDADAVADMLGMWLTMNGHTTTITYNKTDAEIYLAAQKPDLIFIDIWLKDGNGKDLCQQIRATDKTVAIILMSANKQLLEGYELCEANDIIEKPFDIKEVLEKINKLLG